MRYLIYTQHTQHVAINRQYSRHVKFDYEEYSKL